MPPLNLIKYASRSNFWLTGNTSPQGYNQQETEYGTFYTSVESIVFQQIKKERGTGNLYINRALRAI